MSSSVLIFPGGMPRSLRYLDRAIADGKKVIGSSSLQNDPARSYYKSWIYLPYVTSTEFNEALSDAIVKYNLSSIYTPNPFVWDYLNRNLSEKFPDISLANKSPLIEEVDPYKKALHFADTVQTDTLNVGAGGLKQNHLSTIAIASLFHHADVIPGMCDHDKIHGLYETFRFAPLGDVIEIGSWWGKSAFALNWLAKCFKIGKVLCVDPWSDDFVQNDDKGLIDRVDKNLEDAFNLFQINMLPYSSENLNYLRLPSKSACRAYRSSRVVESNIFGETEYSGKISILHIDGNHSYENVRDDIDAWSVLVLPGGWIIIDDYVWPFGKGPQIAGDDYIVRNHNQIQVSFVIGTALFIQLKH